jgi:acyl transferase domain-containing protein
MTPNPSPQTPSALAQTELMKEAWRNAGIPPETVTYIEAHGTGTRLGDPIEIEGITNAFRSYTDKRHFR